MTGLEFDHEHDDYIINFKDEYEKLKARVDSDANTCLNNNIQHISDASKQLIDWMYDSKVEEKGMRY